MIALEEVLEFRSAEEWERWLASNHLKSNGIWIRIFRKGSGVPTVSNSDGVEIALCYGWITGQAKSCDERSWLNRYVPRRPRSIWSKINKEIVERLIREGRMKPAGMQQVEAAKRDGRWQRAYAPQSQAKLPADFLRELHKNKKAAAFANTLNRSNLYAVVFRLENMKTPARRKEKIRQIVEMFSRKEKFH